jgi:iron complex outermembrane receptor protein
MTAAGPGSRYRRPAKRQAAAGTVVVSANRRIEKLEDVPMPRSPCWVKRPCKRNNVREFVDIVNLSPALSISVGTQVGTNSINMRGIGTTSNNPRHRRRCRRHRRRHALLAGAAGVQGHLSDIARVEVLKGPQSTLFGKSSIAGAVVMTTKPIGSGPMQTRVSLYDTSDHEYRVATASLSGRLSDTVGMRLFVSKTNFPGMLHNLTNDTMQNGSGGKSIIAKLQWKVTATST